jgi:hypothetical protein
MKSLNPKEDKNRIVFSPVSLFCPEDKALYSFKKEHFKAI